MNKLFLTIILIGLFTINLFAQNPSANNSTSLQRDVKVSGKIIDKETKEPLEYATISFFSKQQNKVVTGGITDIQGNFTVPVPIGVYNISIEYISFKTIKIENRRITSRTELGTLEMEVDAQALDAVEVIAERTTVEIKLDKKIYNVGKDLTVSGGTVSDVLDNVPSVSVDVEGNVALRGNDDVRILINGKPSGLVGLNSTDALRQLPAESIERVEVITSPSARYDAEGTAGILNIILRRSKLQGMNGAITANIGHPTSAGISGNINYRTGDVNIFNTTGYSYRESPGNSSSSTRYYNLEFDDNGNFINDNPDTFLDEDRKTNRIRKGINTNFGIEWYINDSASWTNSIVYRDSDNESLSTNNIYNFDANRNLTSQSERIEPELEEDKTVQYASNFTKNFESGGEFSAEFQYEDSKELEIADITQNGVLSEIVSTDDEQTRILLQTDFVQPIGKDSRFEVGYRGNFTDQWTDYKVEFIQQNPGTFNPSNNLNYREYVNAAYSQYGSKHGKFSYLLGLRFENTRITINQPASGDYVTKNYSGLFPTLNLNFEFSDTENVTLGYSRRLRRPRSWFINPFPSRSSLTNVFRGNPDLDPTYTNTYDLGYLNRFGKFTLSTSLYYSHSIDAFNFISFDTGEEAIIDGEQIPVIERFPINLGTNERYGYEFNLTYSPDRKWRINGDFNLFKNIIKGEYEGTNFDADNISWRARLSNKYTLPEKIDWQTTVSYDGPRENGQSKSKAMFGLNMALSKDLFKEKASLAFNVSDIFNSRKRQSENFTETFEGTSEFQWRERSFNLSFTYRFNQKKKRQRGRGDWQGGDDMMEFQG
jgi:outer membrane receptor protein involved in Fe transport